MFKSKIEFIVSDEEIILKLNGNSKDKRDAFFYMETKFKGVYQLCYYIQIKGGNDQDVQEIKNAALNDLYFNIIQKKFKGESSLSHYFYSIGIKKWKDRVRYRIKRDDIKEEGKVWFTNSIEDDIIIKERKEYLWAIVDQLGDNCKEMLKKYYVDEYAIESIANHLDKERQTIKNTLTKCRSKLKDLLKNRNI